MTGIVAASVCILAVISAGFVYLDKYVRSSHPIAEEFGLLELVNIPEWAATEPMKEAIVTAAGGKSFELDKGTAKMVAERLGGLAWLYDVTVQTGEETIRISARYRRPLGMVKVGRQSYYVAWAEAGDDLYEAGSKRVVVLDYMAMDKIPVVQIKGFSGRMIAEAGSVWHQEDVTAATEILRVLVKMDQLYPDKGLLEELDHVDVSNFGGRKSNRKPHIVLHAKDGTQVFWGAQIGQEEKYLEPPAKEKAAKLYKFFSENGTVQQKVKYIELRHMQ